MSFYTDDPIRDAARYDAEQSRRLDELPVCHCCGEHIQDEHYYLINDEVYCIGCLESYFKQYVD